MQITFAQLPGLPLTVLLLLTGATKLSAWREPLKLLVPVMRSAPPTAIAIAAEVAVACLTVVSPLAGGAAFTLGIVLPGGLLRARLTDIEDCGCFGRVEQARKDRRRERGTFVLSAAIGAAAMLSAAAPIVGAIVGAGLVVVLVIREPQLLGSLFRRRPLGSGEAQRLLEDSVAFARVRDKLVSARPTLVNATNTSGVTFGFDVLTDRGLASVEANVSRSRVRMRTVSEVSIPA